MVTSRPNVVVIHCHDLGRYLGCYGVDVETPNIDRLAADGALFENFFGTAPQCSPSRGSLWTGRYPHAHGLMGLAHGNWEFHPDQQVLSKRLNDVGYETHLFGLQHVSQDTDRLGYDYVHSEGNLYPGVSPEVHQANRARNVSSIVSAFLEKEAYDAPFFASIGFFELHRVEEENGRFGFESGHYGADDPDEVQPLSYLPDLIGIRRDLASMRGMVYAVDEAVGAILDALDGSAIDGETFVLFTTEHGLAFPRAKGSCYDPGIEVASIVRYPGTVDGGKRHDALLSHVDVVPTILDLIGVDVPSELDGRSFLPLLTGDRYEERERLFAEITWHDMYNPVRAIRTARYKYIRSFWHLPKVYLTRDVFASQAGREIREEYGVPPRPYEELYDLESDPNEVRNLRYEPDYQPVLDDLETQLLAWMEATGDPLLDGPIPPGDYDEIVSWDSRGH